MTVSQDHRLLNRAHAQDLPASWYTLYGLTQEQRRELIQQELKERPQVSDRQIAAGLGVTHPTVAVTRKAMEDAGELEKFTSSIGADGKERPRKVERTSPAETPRKTDCAD